MSRFLKHSKVFDDSKGRFFLVLLTEASDERLSKLSLSITDGNSVWKAATSFEESCGSLKSRREENVKHLMKRISNCRLESIDDAEELTVTLVPPGKTYELKFKKSADGSAQNSSTSVLNEVDYNKDVVSLWCRPGIKDTHAFCILRNITISCAQHGSSAVKRHANMTKHLQAAAKKRDSNGVLLAPKTVQNTIDFSQGSHVPHCRIKCAKLSHICNVCCLKEHSLLVGRHSNLHL
ncbi:uncharacterized protein LOC144113890 isoform X1 [Amblyomma americanum]